MYAYVNLIKQWSTYVCNLAALQLVFDMFKLNPTAPTLTQWCTSLLPAKEGCKNAFKACLHLDPASSVAKESKFVPAKLNWCKGQGRVGKECSKLQSGHFWAVGYEILAIMQVLFPGIQCSSNLHHSTQLYATSGDADAS